MKKVLILSSLLLLLINLNMNGRRVKPIPQDILDGKYTLINIWDGEKMINTKAKKSNILINSKTTSISANFGCNNMSGEIHPMGYLLMPINMVSTEMYCSESINSLESLFGRQIATVNHFSKENNIVKFYQQEQVVIEMKKIVPIKNKKKKK